MVGVSSSTPPINHIVISEVHYDTDAQHGSEPANEWIELYNGTGSDVNVGGWFIGDAASTSADMLPPGTMIADGGFLVITASSTTASFWSIPAESHVVVLPNSIGGNGLANTGDAVFLSNGVSFVDAVSYGTNTDAFSPSVADVASGHSIARTDPSVDTNTASDWADMTTPTPGSE
jgi:hypothetical protein